MEVHLAFLFFSFLSTVELFSSAGFLLSTHYVVQSRSYFPPMVRLIRSLNAFFPAGNFPGETPTKTLLLRPEAYRKFCGSLFYIPSLFSIFGGVGFVGLPFSYVTVNFLLLLPHLWVEAVSSRFPPPSMRPTASTPSVRKGLKATYTCLMLQNGRSR